MNWLRKLRNFFNQKVLLCDLDGTLIVTKSGETFPKDINDWQFKPHIQEAIQEYNPKYIFIISNQGGIEKGFVDEREFYPKFRRIIDEIRTWGDYIVDGTYCTSNDPENVNRKPNTGMVDFFRTCCVMGYDFDKRHALMIGDASGGSSFSNSDLLTAKHAGIRYCDVDKFIWAMCPCAVCTVGQCPTDMEYPCEARFFKSDRLKDVIVKP